MRQRFLSSPYPLLLSLAAGPVFACAHSAPLPPYTYVESFDDGHQFRATLVEARTLNHATIPSGSLVQFNDGQLTYAVLAEPTEIQSVPCYGSPPRLNPANPKVTTFHTNGQLWCCPLSRAHAFGGLSVMGQVCLNEDGQLYQVKLKGDQQLLGQWYRSGADLVFQWNEDQDQIERVNCMTELQCRVQ